MVSVFNDDFDDDPTEAECFMCEKRVELYAPGESYTVRYSQPVHLKCAAEIDEDDAVEGYRPLVDEEC